MSHSAGYGGSTSLVTGDAVPLDLRPAGFASRAVAFGIDFLVQFAALVASFLTLALLTKGNLDEALPVAIGLTLTVLTVVGYPVAFETLSRGRSLGKLALGLRVVSADGTPVRFPAVSGPSALRDRGVLAVERRGRAGQLAGEPPGPPDR